jgi:hypothetical protein
VPAVTWPGHDVLNLDTASPLKRRPDVAVALDERG